MNYLAYLYVSSEMESGGDKSQYVFFGGISSERVGVGMNNSYTVIAPEHFSFLLWARRAKGSQFGAFYELLWNLRLSVCLIYKAPSDVTCAVEAISPFYRCGNRPWNNGCNDGKSTFICLDYSQDYFSSVSCDKGTSTKMQSPLLGTPPTQAQTSVSPGTSGQSWACLLCNDVWV